MVLVHVGYLVLPVFGSVRNRGMTSSLCFFYPNPNKFSRHFPFFFLNVLSWCKQSWHLLAKKKKKTRASTTATVLAWLMLAFLLACSVARILTLARIKKKKKTQLAGEETFYLTKPARVRVFYGPVTAPNDCSCQMAAPRFFFFLSSFLSSAVLG